MASASTAGVGGVVAAAVAVASVAAGPTCGKAVPLIFLFFDKKCEMVIFVILSGFNSLSYSMRLILIDNRRVNTMPPENHIIVGIVVVVCMECSALRVTSY